jgi:glutamate decarboxylase
LFSPEVRETLSEDLIERLITDILAATESLISEKFSHFSLYPKLIKLSPPAHDGSLFSAVEASKMSNQPDHNDARPEKENFGDGGLESEGKGQAGFSRQC